jgi:hypothetical protein
MKKIVLSLSALFAVSIAAAQSYPKQPDTKVYNVVRQAPATKVAEANEAPGNQEVKADARREDTGDANEAQPAEALEKPETLPTTALVKNEEQ